MKIKQELKSEKAINLDHSTAKEVRETQSCFGVLLEFLVTYLTIKKKNHETFHKSIIKF